MKFDPMYNPIPSRRELVYGSRGMVATSHPLAAQAGLDVLKKGGNAVDAAIATAAALTVVEPTGNGLGSDMFAIVWKDGRLHGINGSGRAPLAMSSNEMKRRGFTQMPLYGWEAATVPTAVRSWARLSESLGRLSLKEVLEPAAYLAENGHAVAPVVAGNWKKNFDTYSAVLKDPVFKPLFDLFAPEGRTPRPGQLWKSPDQAKTLRLIGETNAEDFYSGSTARKILEYSMETNGLLCEKDLLTAEPEWVTPIRAGYRGYDIWEMPPNGQGIIALMALNMLNGFEFGSSRDVLAVHRQIEAIKLAFADAFKYVGDMRFSDVPVEGMLSSRYADVRRDLIGETASIPKAGTPETCGTVYLCTADGDGCMVSFIQSNYKGFGSGIVIPGTGISLNNRASGFTLEEGHPNCADHGKRPYITIIPGFITKDGAPVGPFGVMGGYMQPQGHVQVISNMIDFGMNPQQAINAPRFLWAGGLKVELEPEFGTEAAKALARLGHDVTLSLNAANFGRGQMILRTAEGTLAGATEPRADGCVAVW